MRLNRPTNILTNGRFFPPAATTTTAAAAAATAETYATSDIVDASYIGKRVRLNSGQEGTLRFVGATDFGRGVWCGVELDADDGTTDGMVNDVRYFSCPPCRGVFVLVSKVRPARKRPKDAVREYLSGVSDSGAHSLLGIGASVDAEETTARLADRCSAAVSPRYPWRGPATVDPDAMPSPDIDRDESLGILTPDEMGEFIAHSNDVTLIADDEPQLSPLDVDAELTDPLQRLLSGEKLPVDQPSGPETITLMTAGKCDETFTITATAAAPAAMAASFVTSATSIGSWDNGYQSDGECSRPTSRGAVIATTRPSPDPPTDSDFYTESDYEETKTYKCCAQGDRKARIIDGKLFGSPPIVTKLTPVSRSRNSPILTKGAISIDRERSEVSEEMDSSVTYSDADNRVEEKTKSRTKKAPDENSSEAIATSRSYTRVDDDDDDDAFSRETVNNGVETVKVEMRTPSANVKSQNAENALKRPAKCKEFGGVKSTTATKAKIARQNVTTTYKTKTGTISTSSSNGCCDDENQENHRPTSSSSTRVAAKKTNVVGRWDTVLVKVEKEGREDGKTKTTRSKEALSKKGREDAAKMVPSKLHKDVKVFSPNANAMNKAAAAMTTTTTADKRTTATLPDTTKSSKFSKNSASSYRIAKSRKTRTRTEADPPMRSTKNSESSVTSSQKSSIIDISDSRVDSSQHTTRTGARIPTKYVKGTKCSSLLSTPTGDTVVPIVPLHSDLMAAKATKMSHLSLPRTKSAVSKRIGSVNSLNGDLSTNATSTLHTVPRRTAHRAAQPIVSTRASNRAPTTNGRVKNNPLRSAHDENSRRTRRVDANNCKLADDETTQLSRISKINPLLARLKYATDGMEAFIILFQKLASDMDVFALDRIKRELSKSKKDCWDMKMKLEEANVSYDRLKDEIETVRSTHERKLKELRDIHTAQLNRLNENQKQELDEHLNMHKMELEKLKNEFKNREDALRAKYDENLRTLRKQAEQKLDDILQETKLQVERLKMENEAWKDKVLEESRKKLQTVDAKYKDEIRTMETNYTNLLDQMARQERKRKETVAKSATSYEGELDGKMDHGGGESSDVKIEGRTLGAQNVEDEICSLRTVLELKHGEIQELRKQNEKFKKAAQDLPFVEQKLDSVQARVEDLRAQLEAKVEIEKQLLKENRRLLDAVHYENEKKKRLAFQNEELWWKLKNSARVAKTLAVYNSSGNKDEGRTFAHSTPLHPKGPGLKSLKRSRTEHDMKRIDMSDNDEEIDDISSKVLAVVEKNDSVSWVLEIDESPVAVASRMLKRANSLTGIASKRRNKTQHQLHHSFSVPAGNQNDSRATTTVESTYNGE